MPKADRTAKNTKKDLEKAAKSKGQKSLSAFFQSKSDLQTNSRDDETSEQQNETQQSVSESIPQETEPSTTRPILLKLSNPWITRNEDYSAEQKQLSENGGRYFQGEWLLKHKWLMYNLEKKAAYCKICTENKQPQDSSPFVFTQDSPGFSNWKKGTERLGEHENSIFHSKASKSVGTTVETLFSKERDNLQHLRRQGLVAHLRSLKLLMRQGISVRGHDEEESNIMQFNKDKSLDNQGLDLLLKENQYLSHRIIEEQEELIVLSARKRLIQEITSKHFYAIICDESSDISKTEQLSFSVRFCDDTYNIYESFIGLYPCDQGLTSESLLNYVKDILIRCNFEFTKLISTAFDGASNMKKLSSLIKENISESALYIHCFAHCNELVFKDAAVKSPMISDAQELCENIYALAGVSPKRVLLFEEVQKEILDTSEARRGILKLKQLSRTRWTTRGAAADVLLKKYVELQEVLFRLINDSTVAPDCRCKAKGLLKKMQSLTSIFNLMSMHEIALLLEKNSKQLQSSSLTAEQATGSIEKCYILLQNLRSDSEFLRIFEQAKLLVSNAKETDSEPPTKRKRYRPANLQDYFYESSLDEGENNMEEKLKQEFFETIDILRTSIEARFHQKDIESIHKLEKCLINAAAGNVCSVQELYSINNLPKSLNLEALHENLKELHIHLKLYNKEVTIPLHIFEVSQICKVLNHRLSSKQCLSELHKVLLYYRTIPMGSATAERSFSVMRRIKSWLRATLSANSLNHFMFSNIHKRRMDDIDLQGVASEFINVNDKRKKYFGSF